MAYSTLKAAIQAVIKQNGNNEITGPILQQALLSMINSLGDGYQFKGVATPATNPGTPDQNVFYIASEVGTYSNFGLSVGENEVAVFLWNGSWSKQSTGAATSEAVSQLRQEATKAGLDNSKLFPFVNSGKYINLQSIVIGEQYTISRNSATNYGNWELDCDEGDQFALSVGGNTVAAKRYAILDANNYVLDFLQGDGSFVTDYIVTIPAGGKKLLVNSSSSGEPVVKKLNAVSEQLAEFEEKALIKEQQSLTDIEKGQVKDNLGFVSQDDLNIPITNFISGYFIFSATNLQVGDKLYLKPNPNSGYKYVIINCNEGDIFVATTTGHTANAKSYAILDIHSCVLALGSANLNNSEITIPAGGKQIVFNTTQATPNVVLYAGKLTKSLEGVEALNRELHTYKDLGYSESGYYSVANTVNVGDTLTINKLSSPLLVCTLLNCQYGDKFSYKGKKNGANRTYVFLDSNNVVVGISGDANATYEGEVVAPLTSAKVIFNTTTDIEYYLKKYVSIIDEQEEKIGILSTSLSTSILAILPLYWRDQYLSVIGNVGNVATLTPLSFSNYGYLKIPVKAGYIFKISTSGNTSNAKAYAVLDEGLVIKEIQQNSVTNKVITIEEDGWLIVNSNKNSYSIEMVNGNLLWGNQTFYSLFSKLYDVARFNNNHQFDQARIEQLEVNGIKLGFYQNVPLEGQYINTDIFERGAITNQSSLDFIQKRIVPYLYWNQNKVGTMVLFDEATGKPYFYDKNGNKVMLKIEE